MAGKRGAQMEKEIVYQGIMAIISGLLLGSLCYFLGSLTGKNKAEVRGINAKSRSDEIAGEISAFDLAQKAMAELDKLRNRVTALETEKASLNARVEILERENAELRAENAELRRNRKGLANR
jgi:chromosome segregation ATPase